MTDRELLELAAKAAGLTTTHKWNAERQAMTPPVMALVVHRAGELVSTGWDPLTDDGAALRLAVKLKITPYIDGNLTDCDDCTEAHLGDPYAATRRAIVRAAAEIGGNMK